MIKINFFGTQDFAKIILEGLIESSDFEIATVFTMPDRPVGRKQVLQSSPVKILAEENGLKIETPSNLTTPNPLLRKEGTTAVPSQAGGEPRTSLPFPRGG